ncbi:MAG TPA: nitrile hydratase [Kiloniellaceae bacterium]
MSKEEAGGGPGSSHVLLRRHHDMGGLPAGAVELGEHDYAPWEKRVDAILRLLADSKRRLITTDELRRGIEELGPGAYDEMSYYERWIASITNNLLEKGVITVDELGRRMAEIAAAWPAGTEKRP